MKFKTIIVVIMYAFVTSASVYGERTAFPAHRTVKVDNEYVFPMTTSRTIVSDLIKVHSKTDKVRSENL